MNDSRQDLTPKAFPPDGKRCCQCRAIKDEIEGNIITGEGYEVKADGEDWILTQISK